MGDFYFIRAMRSDEWDAVAGLIHESTNGWYREHLNREIFGPEAGVCRVFPEVYEALDPGCCLVAEERGTGRLAGSCFYHPRETHWALGIMNSRPGTRGAAKALLVEILRRADEAGLPVRLVSSAGHLDSFSLYSRAGFVPVRVFQDMFLAVPADGMEAWTRPEMAGRVRVGTLEDVAAMVALEEEISGIRREKDHRFFVENAAGIWRTLVVDSAGGGLDGFLTSVGHPGSRMLGPGVAREKGTALALVWEHLDRFHRGHAPVWLAPADEGEFVKECYGWGARNAELHLAQVRGGPRDHAGLIFPTFMPETG